MPILPIAIAIGLVADRIASNQIPKKVTAGIQKMVTKKLKAFELEWQASIKRDTQLFTGLAFLTLLCVGLNQAGFLPANVHLGVVFIAYGVPLFFTLRFAWQVVQYGPRILSLNEHLTTQIKSYIEGAGLGKKALLSIYDSRTPEQLAEVAVGKAVFTFLEFAKQNRKTWLTLLACYLLSYVALLTLRFQI